MANLTMQQAKALLRARGFSPSAIEQLRIALADDAVRNSDDIKADRLYTIVAMTLRNAYGFGYKRIFKGLKEFDRLNGLVSSEELPWDQMMEELHKTTGLIVRTGTGDRIGFEYNPEGE